MVDQLVTKENALIYINIVVAYLIYFSVPTDFVNSSTFIISTIVLFVIVVIFEISSRRPFYNFLFKRQLAQLEIKLREIDEQYNYYKLKKEGRKEIDKIDGYFFKYATSFSGLLLASIILTFLILFQFLGLVHHKLLFQVQSINIYSEYIVLILLILNFLFMYDNYKELKQYIFTDFKRIYEIYGVTNGKK